MRQATESLIKGKKLSTLDLNARADDAMMCIVIYKNQNAIGSRRSCAKSESRWSLTNTEILKG